MSEIREDNNVGIKIGVEFAKWEINKLNAVVETRELIREVKEVIVPALKIIRDSGVQVKEVDLGWWCRVYLARGVRLKEKTYNLLAEHFQDWPEMTVTGVGRFSFRVRALSHRVSYFDVILGDGACRVKEIREKVVREVEEETVRWELVGDCSGLEA